MKNAGFILLIALFLALIGYLAPSATDTIVIKQDNMLSYVVNPVHQNLTFYWKNAEGKLYNSFQNIKDQVEQDNQTLVFATNGGMFKKDFSPQGLYIENGIELAPIDRSHKDSGNFYLQPNGIFYLTKESKPTVCATEHFQDSINIQYATQSGPMLLINGIIHPKFTKGSNNLHFRNGVGILPSGQILFAMSKEKINFFDFASYFKINGCQDALYLDGFVSKTYLPNHKWNKIEGGPFGVIIGEIKQDR